MNAHNRVNPLVSSVVHLPFRKACRDLGFSVPDRQRFVADVEPLLRDAPLDLPDVDGLAERLWHAVLAGEVLAAEWLEDGRVVFHVRGQYRRDGVDLRLVNDHGSWHVAAVTSVHRHPWLRTRWARRGGVAAAVIAALAVGYGLPHPGGAASPQTGLGGADNAVAATASSGAGTLASRSNAPSPQVQNASAGAQSGSAAQQKPKTPAPTPVVFNLKEGVPLHNLSVFLYQHHLVKNPVAFDMKMKDSGVDRHLRPGTYRFMSNMTEDEVLKVLAKGPSS
jgi:hypothetical protein